MPLVQGKGVEWRNEIFIQMSEFITGRALRTDRWTYAAGSLQRGVEIPIPQTEIYSEYRTPNLTGGSTPEPYADRYVEYQLYDLSADPHQLVNLAGRDGSLEAAAELRKRLKGRIAEVGDHAAAIDPPVFSYP